MPKTRLTSFSALSDYPRVGISRSASETDVWLVFFFLPMTLKGFIFYSSFFHFDILRRITTFLEGHLVIFMVVHKWRHFWNLESWRHF